MGLWSGRGTCGEPGGGPGRVSRRPDLGWTATIKRPSNCTLRGRRSQAQTTRCSGCIWVVAATCCGTVLCGPSTLARSVSTIPVGSSTAGASVLHRHSGSCARAVWRDRRGSARDSIQNGRSVRAGLDSPTMLTQSLDGCYPERAARGAVPRRGIRARAARRPVGSMRKQSRNDSWRERRQRVAR